MSDPTPSVDGIRQRPKVGPTRCPYCHDSCAASDPETCVCGDCLSRHHIACWEEASGCGSCRSQHRLQSVTAATATTSSPSSAPEPSADAEAPLEAPQEEEQEAQGPEWTPVEFGPGGKIVIRGEIPSEVGEPVGGEVESREDLSSLFVLGNAGVVAGLLWLMYKAMSSI